jgi:hypothetical protein
MVAWVKLVAQTKYSGRDLVFSEKYGVCEPKKYTTEYYIRIYIKKYISFVITFISRTFNHVFMPNESYVPILSCLNRFIIYI